MGAFDDLDEIAAKNNPSANVGSRTNMRGQKRTGVSVMHTKINRLRVMLRRGQTLADRRVKAKP